jgi:3-methyladenine DNA glycosylase Tag
MSIPEQIDDPQLADYLEVMTKAIFQAGVSWKMVDNKWDAFREVFKQFDPKKVAKLTKADVDLLMEDKRVLRSRNKIDATIANAQTLLELDREFGGFQKYLHSKKSYDELSADIRKHFKYMGDMNVYYLLFRVKESVPPFEDWVQTIPGDHPRMKEMVELARKKIK